MPLPPALLVAGLLLVAAPPEVPPGAEEIPLTEGEIRLEEEVQSVGSLEEAQGADSLASLLKSAQDPRPPVRSAAMVALAARPEPEAREALLKGLYDPNRVVRQFAASGVGRSGGGPSAQALAPLLQDPEPTLRAEALHGIARQGGVVYGSYLLTGLKDVDPVVRRTAAQEIRPLIGRLAPDPTLLTLLDAARDPDPGIRFLSAWGLGVLGNPSATTALEGLTRDPSPPVQKAARESLKKIGRPAAEDAVPAPPPPAAFQGSLELSQGASAGLKEAASTQIRVLGVGLGDPLSSAERAFGPLTYRNDALHQVRFQGIQVTGDAEGKIARITLYPDFFRAHGGALDDSVAGEARRRDRLGTEDEQEEAEVNVLGAQFTRMTYRWNRRGLELVVTETPAKKALASFSLGPSSAL